MVQVKCFVRISQQTDYFPIQRQLTGFITETESVYCAVRTDESVTENSSVQVVRQFWCVIPEDQSTPTSET